MALRLYEILRKDVFSDIETGPRSPVQGVTPSTSQLHPSQVQLVWDKEWYSAYHSLIFHCYVKPLRENRLLWNFAIIRPRVETQTKHGTHSKQYNNLTKRLERATDDTDTDIIPDLDFCIFFNSRKFINVNSRRSAAIILTNSFDSWQDNEWP